MSELENQAAGASPEMVTETATETAETTQAPAQETLLSRAGSDQAETQGKEGEGQSGEPAKPEDAKVDVPDEYKLQAPEGVTLDQALLEQFTPLAKEMKLTNDQAQKLADLYSSQLKAAQERQIQTWNESVQGWEKAARADKEIGGDSLHANLDAAGTVLKKFGTPELTAFLEQGFGNHPELVRCFARIGRAMQEDRQHVKAAPAVETSVAKVLYPSMN